MTAEICWVYVFSRKADAGLTKPVKVGISRNVDGRLSTVQTACPFKIDMAYVFECPNREIAEYLERSFHDTQKSACLHGEWFDYEPVEAIHLLCIGYRVMLELTCSDQKTRSDSLECAGVLWAEKRFGLEEPTDRAALQ